MLAGCSSAVLLQRHQLTMGTQRFELPCSFAIKEAQRVAISLEKPGEGRNSCSFRQNPLTPSSSSLVAQTATWEGKREIEGGEIWERGRSLKRFYERSSFEDPHPSQAKRTRTGTGIQIIGGDDDLWLPHSVEEPLLVEEEGCFMPGAAIYPSKHSSSSASWFRTETSDRGEKDVAGRKGTKTKSDSSSSSDTHSSSPNPNGDSSENDTGNGSWNPGPIGVVGYGEDTQTEHKDLELVDLLTACVESISSCNYTTISYLLARLGEMASPAGTPTHRVVAYFTEALALRVVKLWPQIFCIAPPREFADQMDDDDDAMAFRLLNQVSPIPKFLHFTLNERLLRAFEGKDRVHIIDFDIKQGLQWPSLLQSLASRPNPPSHVRITGIGESKQDLQDTGARLAGFAETLNLPFEFHPVVDRLEDVRLWMLHVKEGECVAVNCIFQLHKALCDDSQVALMDLLGLIRSTNPAIVLVAEQEAEHNDPRWEMRWANALKYYSAIFDSLNSSLPKNSLARIKIEEMFARKVRNIVSFEGLERIERHEIFDRWRKLMEDGGFRNAGIGERETLQSNMLLRLYPSQNYRVEKQGEDDGLTLKWLEQPLYTVSAWAPVDIAGSSSISQPG